MKKLLVIFLSVSFVVIGFRQANAGVIYENDFEGAVGPEWSSSITDVTPAGARRFLGTFVTETVMLTLNSVPNNQDISLSFDLFIINTWDGSQLVDPLHAPPTYLRISVKLGSSAVADFGFGLSVGLSLESGPSPRASRPPVGRQGTMSPLTSGRLRW